MPNRLFVMLMALCALLRPAWPDLPFSTHPLKGGIQSWKRWLCKHDILQK